ncbi:hypothetical protein [Actinoplanes sp. NPDC089786]|uniref:hypothetical protein n=1 Tax=Actinoplanes sp. NPDC089786 TaxID=3155185 RepID=UPI003435C968
MHGQHGLALGERVRDAAPHGGHRQARAGRDLLVGQAGHRLEQRALAVAGAAADPDVQRLPADPGPHRGQRGEHLGDPAPGGGQIDLVETGRRAVRTVADRGQRPAQVTEPIADPLPGRDLAIDTGQQPAAIGQDGGNAVVDVIHGAILGSNRSHGIGEEKINRFLRTVNYLTIRN